MARKGNKISVRKYQEIFLEILIYIVLISISLALMKLGIPVIAFCDTGDEEEEGGESSICARPPAEGPASPVSESNSGEWKKYLQSPSGSDATSPSEPNAVQHGSTPSTSKRAIEPSLDGPITPGSPTDSWFAGAETEISKKFPNLAPADQGEDIRPHSGAGASHCASNQGEGVEVFEIPSSPAPEEAQRMTQTEVASQLALRERQSCEEIINRIIAFPRIQEKIQEAEHRFPGITLEVPPAKAVDLILKDLITGEISLRGMMPGAETAAIRSYKKWLSRVQRGSNVDDFSYNSKPQSHRHDIDIQD